jgi:hypothetical protein
MRKHLFYSLVGLLLAVGLLSSCGEKKPKRADADRSDTTTSGAIKFASDDSFSPIIDEQVEIFNQKPGVLEKPDGADANGSGKEHQQPPEPHAAAGPFQQTREQPTEKGHADQDQHVYRLAPCIKNKTKNQ